MSAETTEATGPAPPGVGRVRRTCAFLALLAVATPGCTMPYTLWTIPEPVQIGGGAVILRNTHDAVRGSIDRLYSGYHRVLATRLEVRDLASCKRRGSRELPGDQQPFAWDPERADLWVHGFDGDDRARSLLGREMVLSRAPTRLHLSGKPAPGPIGFSEGPQGDLHAWDLGRGSIRAVRPVDPTRPWRLMAVDVARDRAAALVWTEPGPRGVLLLASRDGSGGLRVATIDLPATGTPRTVRFMGDGARAAVTFQQEDGRTDLSAFTVGTFAHATVSSITRADDWFWSPRGRWLATVQADPGAGPLSCRRSGWQFDFLSGERRALTSPVCVSWLRWVGEEGWALVAETNFAGIQQLWSLQAGTGIARRLPPTVTGDVSFGDELFFLEGTPNERLLVASLRTGGVSAATEALGDVRFLSADPDGRRLVLVNSDSDVFVYDVRARALRRCPG